jgi:hypothetical protein
MADMTTIKGKIRDTIYPNGTGAITAEKHQSLLLDVVDNINELKQDTLVSGQNIRPLISGESLLGSDALGVLGTKFIYDLENQQLFAMIDGAQQDFHIWMANRAVHSQVAQVIEIQKEGYFKELVPLTIKNKAGVAVLCWEYDGMIYEASMEDNVLAVVSKPKGDEFDKEGNYPLLHVGIADDLAGRGESVPASFGFRASGGKSIKDGRAYIKRIKGNSVVWNNYFDIEKISVDGGTMSRDGNRIVVTATGEFPRIIGYTAKLGTLPKGNVVLITFNADKELGINFPSSAILGQGYANGYEWQLFVVNEYNYFTIYHNTESYTVDNIRIIDLTKMFGAGNEPTTIEEFNARKPMIADEYAYNEGEVIHMNTESIKSVGDNAWDEEWDLKGVVSGKGTIGTWTDRIASVNFIPCIPNESYHFKFPVAGWYIFFYDKDYQYIGEERLSSAVSEKTIVTPSNAAYMKFSEDSAGYGTTYNNDIMITLVHSGWKQDTDAGYQPYWQDTLPLPIIRKYFPDGMKSAGSAHDEIRYNKASGKWEYSEGRIRSKALSELNWVIGSTGVFMAVVDDMVAILNTTTGIIGKYILSIGTGVELLNNEIDKGYCTNGGAVGGVGKVAIRDNAYTNVDAFKQHLEETNAILYYESNNWEWVELDAEDQNFRDYYKVADFGTEQSQSSVPSVPSANFSADIIYQFNAVDMIREHELEITELQQVIATMQAQLTALTNGGQ